MPKSPFDALVRDGVLSRETLQAVGERAGRIQMSVSWVLIHEQRIPVETVGKCLAAHYRTRFEAFQEGVKAPADLPPGLTPELCGYYRVAPIARERGRLVLLMADPGNLPDRDTIEAILGEPFDVRVALPEDITRILTGSEPEPQIPFEAVEVDTGDKAEENVDVLISGEDGGSSASVVFLNGMLMELVRQKAAELRFDPRTAPAAGMRLGEVWKEIPVPPGMLQPLVRRLKVMANLNLTNRSIEQKGTFELRMTQGRRVRFDVAIDPVGDGDEAALLRQGQA